MDQANGSATSPLLALGGSADTTTAASGSFTFAQDAATWYKNGTAAGHGAQALGFSFSSDGILMYGNTASVPEPTTYGMLAGAGMLLMAIRRQFSRKA